MSKFLSFQTQILLILILAVAILVRFILPNQSPPSLNWDEASLGYNAYSILKTGKDEWGRRLPLSFEAFGDYKLPGYIYTLVPFIHFLGLNEQSVRLPSRIAGVLAVLIIFLLTKEITNNKIALLSALLLAISPWHIFLSRIGLEANLALTFFLTALYFFLRGFKNLSFLFLAAVFFGLTIFTYNSARVFIPLFLLGSFIIFKEQIIRQGKKLVLPTIVLSFFIGLAAILAIFYDSSSRYFWVAIVDQGAINYLNEARTTSTFPIILTNLIYNRYVYFISQFIPNYLSHFSFDFLFFSGGSHYQFSLPNTGLLYLIELPLIILGLIKILKTKNLKLLLVWILVAPIPSAVTREAPHALRAIFMIGILQIFASLGLFFALELIKIKKIRKIILVLFPIILLISSFVYLHKYFVSYPNQYSSAWQYGTKEAIAKIDRKKYDQIYISKRYGEPHIFYLFYTKYDPHTYQNNPTLVRYEKTNWRWVDRLDNITFVNDWEAEERLKESTRALLVTSPGNFPEGAKIIDSVYFLDGSKAFDLVEFD